MDKFELLAIVFLLATGGTLAFVGFRHGMGALGGSLFFKENRDRLFVHIDSKDKKLLCVALGCFIVGLIFLALSF
jgi:hypothetical protein